MAQENKLHNNSTKFRTTSWCTLSFTTFSANVPILFQFYMYSTINIVRQYSSTSLPIKSKSKFAIHTWLHMTDYDHGSAFRVLRDNEIYIMQICLSCFVMNFGRWILSKRGQLGGPVPIALLYYSANVIAVLCVNQLIMRTWTSVSHRLSTRYPDGIDFAIKLINATPAAANHTLLF